MEVKNIRNKKSYDLRDKEEEEEGGGGCCKRLNFRSISGEGSVGGESLWRTAASRGGDPVAVPCLSES